jgi:hypothetical protein
MASVDTECGGLYTRHVISTPADLPVGERPARAELLPETRRGASERKSPPRAGQDGPGDRRCNPSGPGSWPPGSRCGHRSASSSRRLW